MVKQERMLEIIQLSATILLMWLGKETQSHYPRIHPIPIERSPKTSEVSRRLVDI